MTSIVLSQSTQNKINFAMTTGPGVNNQNYVAAYNAISSEINANGGFNPGTQNWFSQAGPINGQASNPTAPGTYIWNYTTAAAQAQGTTLTSSDLQAASNKIARTVFEQLQTSGFLFSDNSSDPINFARPSCRSMPAPVSARCPTCIQVQTLLTRFGEAHCLRGLNSMIPAILPTITSI